jgi:hypothetical protein
MLAGRHDPRAVGVGEKDVVVVGQEAHGHACICRGTGRIREVEELDPVLVVKSDEARAELFESRPHRQAGPGAHVGGGSRTKGREVAKHQLLGSQRRYG